MRNTIEENIEEHTLQTAMIAYHLCVLHNTYYKEDGKVLDGRQAALLALYHDVSEVYTGDMPTPVKYFSDAMRKTYGAVETLAQKRLVSTLPKELQQVYEPLICHGEEDPLWPYVKAADILSAYIKCMQEKHSGNEEFNEAYKTIQRRLEDLHMPEVERFLSDYAPSFLLSLDALSLDE